MCGGPFLRMCAAECLLVETDVEPMWNIVHNKSQKWPEQC